ncbi:hypothetical protein SDC9_65119 [bioreactor metagenome]|uniref:Translation initiation factor 2 n=1 Tax=bioreactor metagenome TaxID=1076179 RepID=A0A644XR71_9ZZZZ|nr:MULTISPECIES: hypothetical protein [unclassified Oscillibacter]MEA4992547.1 hypothetical protein [Oscillibacter sp.]
MVKGISRRVVVVDSPDRRYFEQAIFIVRNDAAGEGVSSRELVEEARRVAQEYAGGSGLKKRLNQIPPVLWSLTGAGACGLAWLLVSVL